MKRLFFAFIFLFSLVSCATTSSDLKPFGVRCDIKIDASAVVITAEYYGADWEYLYGVDLKNSRGETRIVRFDRTSHDVLENGRVHEFGVSVATVYTEKLREFLNDDEILAQVRCKRGWYEFEPAHVWRKD